MCQQVKVKRSGERLAAKLSFRLTETEKKLLAQLGAPGKEAEAARQIVRQHLKVFASSVQKVG